jgi:hypothetical protein
MQRSVISTKRCRYNDEGRAGNFTMPQLPESLGTEKKNKTKKGKGKEWD